MGLDMFRYKLYGGKEDVPAAEYVAGGGTGLFLTGYGAGFIGGSLAVGGTAAVVPVSLGTVKYGATATAFGGVAKVLG